MKRILTLAALTTSISAFGSFLPKPNGCTFYKEPFLSNFKGCAEYRVHMRGCTKTRCLGPVCTKYKGDRLSMYLPDYFIEVTPHFGQSKFTRNLIFGPSLKLHLRSAVKYWNSTGAKISLWSSYLQDGGETQPGMKNYYARILTVPFAAGVTVYPSQVQQIFRSKGVGAPFCYDGISEMFPAQWRDNKLDGVFAAATATAAYPLCNNPAGSVAGEVLQSAKEAAQSGLQGLFGVPAGIEGDPKAFGNCSLPAPSMLIKAGMMSPSSDPFRSMYWPPGLCLGTLGNKFPRSRATLVDDSFHGALISGLRFASLAGDTYQLPQLRVEPDDKIQQIYPRPLPGFGSASCYRPGRLTEIFTAIRHTTSHPSDRASENKHRSGSYVFAVWKKRESCQEPAFRAFWEKPYGAQISFNRGLCSSN